MDALETAKSCSGFNARAASVAVFAFSFKRARRASEASL